MTIQVLSEKQVPVRETARQIRAAESTVRYHLSRQRSGAADGCKEKPFAAAQFAVAIESWRAEYGEGEHPPNLLELYEHLVRVHGHARATRTASCATSSRRAA